MVAPEVSAGGAEVPTGGAEFSTSGKCNLICRSPLQGSPDKLAQGFENVVPTLA